nr:FUSC family protein [Leifsonia sp. Leaf325]
MAAELFADSVWGQNSMAGWPLLTILVVARSSSAETWHRVVNRSPGTIAGGLGALALALVIPVEWPLAVIGLIALAVAILVQPRKSSRALYSVALTASIVLLNRAPRSTRTRSVRL